MNTEVKSLAPRTASLAGLVMFTVAGVLVSCSEERPLKPAPENYRLYVAMGGNEPSWDSYLLSIDCQADTVVDSLFLPEWHQQYWEYLSATPQPGIIVTTTGQVDGVVDTRRGEVIASLEGRFPWLAYFPELGRVVGANASRTVVFEDSNFSARKVWEQELSGCRRMGRTSRAVGRARFNPIGGAPYGPFLIYDVASDSVIDSFLVDPLQDGVGFAFAPDFEISPDGKRIYGSGEDATGSWILGYDIQQRKTLFKRPPTGLSNFEFCFVTPDSREVWVLELANPFGYPWSTSIHVLDAFSGSLLDTIDLSGPALGWDGPIALSQIRFLPSQPKAYVSFWTNFIGPQPLVVIATDTRTISKVLFRGRERIPSQIALGPSP